MMALLSFWSFILVGCFAVSLAGASSLSELYPALWEESPGQFSDFKVENNVYIINPWAYLDRMGMYKILLNNTARYFEKFGPENEQNILWGLPLQYSWQHKTGRLADPSKRTSCGYESGDPLCISVDSWWADVNYFLGALPFLAAVDSGILGVSPDQVKLLPPPKDQMKFCYDVSSCLLSFPEKMTKWNLFYQYMQSPSSNFDGLLKHLWDAHSASLENTGDRFKDRYAYYSKPEEEFGKNWTLIVEYLAASRFPTTMIRVHEAQKGLPPRILLDTDVAPFISDFTSLQNTLLSGVNIVSSTHKLTGSSSLTLWKLLMNTQLARRVIVEIVDRFLFIVN
ncbi:protein LEG1 homolog [Ochotona curzoniae]|uniref:protein LEG1 homolog n=1 Tax=Ochotona curzoniae TaxID=130825 RepID=UPI001B34F238|nr:protein LEG1 homolog [Ochotona curzoniae]